MEQGKLQQSDIPPGQKYIKSFIYYACLGLPEVNLATYRLSITGNVKNPVSLSYPELQKLATKRVERDFHCVTSWSIKGTVWEGIPMKELFDMAGVLADTTWVMFVSLDGYTTPVPFEDATDPEAIVALRLNGKELPIEMGFPARPFIPHLYGWKSAKWLTEIQLLKEYRDGYWEERGYHERGNVWEEERFKQWGRHLKRSPLIR
ncbi:MAG: sulfite oxidase-like oxidoreductase [Conexivisphaerales archaeon]